MPSKANLINEVRVRHALTQEQLAFLLGVSFTTINAWENGRRRVPIERQVALRELLNCERSIAAEKLLDEKSGLARSDAGFVSSVISYNGRRDSNPVTHGIGRWYGNLPSFLVSDIVKFCKSDLGHIRRALVNFCGSGTAALEFGLAGIDCDAIDVNPVAWLLSTLKTQEIDAPTPRAIKSLVAEARESQINLRQPRATEGNLITTENKWITPLARRLLLQATAAINHKRDLAARFVYTAALLNVSIDFCQIDKRCTNHYVFKHNAVSSDEFFEKFESECLSIAKRLKSLGALNGYKRPKISLQDNRNTAFADGAYDVVFSHPPYGTMINYFSMSRVHLSIVELIDLGLKVSSDGILAATRQADQSSSTNQAFANSIPGWVREASRLLAVNGHLICIIGDGRDKGFLSHHHVDIISHAEAAGMRLKELFIWVTENKSGMHVKRKGHHIDHNYILVLQKISK